MASRGKKRGAATAADEACQQQEEEEMEEVEERSEVLATPAPMTAERAHEVQARLSAVMHPMLASDGALSERRLCQARGLGGVCMRGATQACPCAPTTLYRHVSAAAPSRPPERPPPPRPPAGDAQGGRLRAA